MKKIRSRRRTVEETLSAARVARPKVKRELTDQEIDHDRKQGRAGIEKFLIRD